MKMMMMKKIMGLIKNLAGGKYVVEGRRFGKVDQFKFTWQSVNTFAEKSNL